MNNEYPRDYFLPFLYVLMLTSLFLIALYISYQILILGVNTYPLKAYAAIPSSLFAPILLVRVYKRQKKYIHDKLILNEKNIIFGFSHEKHVIEWREIKTITVDTTEHWVEILSRDNVSYGFTSLDYKISTENLLAELELKKDNHSFNVVKK